MKKKHLRSLQSLEKWLHEHQLMGDDLKSALTLIREKVESVVEEAPESRPLDRPSELENDPSAVALFTDGGCRGNPGPGAFAYVIQKYDGTIIAEGVEYESYTTNNKMELSGPTKGLHDLCDILPGIGLDPLLTKVKVITDSKYVVDGMKSWVAGWKARDWKKADGKAPENLEYWQELDKIRHRFLEIEWIWVKGHGGHPQNEYCDRKANEVMDANLTE